jgi:hypothetical protein
MHKAACDQLIFVGDAVLRYANQVVGKLGPGELCGDGHSPWSIISTMRDRKPARARALIPHRPTVNPISLGGPNNRSEYWLLVPYQGAY